MGWKPNFARPCRRLQDRGTHTSSLSDLKTGMAVVVGDIELVGTVEGPDAMRKKLDERFIQDKS